MKVSQKLVQLYDILCNIYPYSLKYWKQPSYASENITVTGS
jgi:hypothetical protein